ncbi:MAG: aromatic ring-hydroxylating dioxygenase subunit alpha [Actinomycetota bacterium]|nr:aromatic ring-hydroxylating dioxygenase subunit alpha [Actinomycetota bacterium]
MPELAAESVAAALERGETLPWTWYTDPAVAAFERERIFGRAWQYAGWTGEVARPGDFATTRAGELPVVLVRGADGELRAFLNVCRHRGSLVCEGSGNAKSLRCLYHAWTYDLDGSLRAAPRSDREPGFDRDELGLRRLALDAWGPFVFVNPDLNAPPLAEALGNLPAAVAAAGVDVGALRFHGRSWSSFEANWKICCENFLECYHCAVAHPGFSAVIDVDPDAYGLEVTGELHSTQIGPVRDDPRSSFRLDGEVPRGQFHFVWPNTTMNVSPGRPNFSIGPMLPEGPEKTTRWLDLFFAPDADEEWIAEFLAWEMHVGAEDKVLVERVQKGVRAGVGAGRLLPESERLVAHFQRLTLRALSDDAT